MALPANSFRPPRKLAMDNEVYGFFQSGILA
jgi:hypothetical protein